jgi:hypothetical protein
MLSTGLALAICAACDALECIIDLPEHPTANARRGYVDVLLYAADGKLHFISRLNGRKSFGSVSGADQKLLSLLQQHCSVRAFSYFQCRWHCKTFLMSDLVFTSSFSLSGVSDGLERVKVAQNLAWNKKNRKTPVLLLIGTPIQAHKW